MDRAALVEAMWRAYRTADARNEPAMPAVLGIIEPLVCADERERCATAIGNKTFGWCSEEPCSENVARSVLGQAIAYLRRGAL